MEVFRLSREKYSKKLSGTGAAKLGGRWNSIGAELIYTASNRSLAMAEVVVHLTAAMVPEDYQMTTIYIPDNTSIRVINEKELPERWNEFPPLRDTQLLGDKFITENKYCLLKIPSAVTKGDFNILINPGHTESKQIKIIDSEPFPFDKRIFKP